MEILPALFLLMLMAAVGSRGAGPVTTCFAPPAYLGEPSLLNCNFDTNVNELSKKPSLNVRRVDRFPFEYHRDQILDCEWLPNLECSTHEGYEFDNKVSNELTIIIPNVTWEHAGKYQCQLVGEPAGDTRSCDLTVSERVEPTPPARVPSTSGSSQVTPEIKTDPTPYKTDSEASTGINPAAIVVPVVIGVVVVAIVAAVIFILNKRGFIWCKKRQQGRGQPDHREQSDEEERMVSPAGTADPTATDMAKPEQETNLGEGDDSKKDMKKEEEDTPRKCEEPDDQEQLLNSNSNDIASPDTITPEHNEDKS